MSKMSFNDALLWCDAFQNNIILKTNCNEEKHWLALKAVAKAKEAIMVQIPRKVVNMECPCCGKRFVVRGMRISDPYFCSGCGQALDWGEEHG